MTERQAEIKQETSWSGCSACKRHKEHSRDTAQRRAEKTSTCPQPAPVPSLHHTSPGGAASTASPPPRSGFCCYFFPFRGTPGSLCSSQAASACSNFHLFQLESLPQKGARNLSSCEAERRDADKQSLPCLGPLLRASFIIYQRQGHTQPPPAPGRGRAAPHHRLGLIRFGPCQQHLAAWGRSMLHIQRQGGAWGLTQSRISSRSSHEAQLEH